MNIPLYRNQRFHARRFGLGDDMDIDPFFLQPGMMFDPVDYDYGYGIDPDILSLDQPGGGAADAATGSTAKKIAAGLSPILQRTVAQLTAQLKQGSLVKTTACAGGYANAAGVCQTVKLMPSTDQWFSGVSNQTLVVIGIAVVGTLVLVVMKKSGGRRR